MRIMSDAINVTIVGHSSTGLNALEYALQEKPGIDVTRKLLLDSYDPLEDLPVASNVIVLDLGDNWREILDAVASRSRRNRTPMILVGPDDNTEMMRLALRAGARDFQTRPLNSHELLTSVFRLADESQLSDLSASAANAAVFMSAKGGAGSSAIISALGQALIRRTERPRVLLVDLDLQYGNLPLYFDDSSTTRLTQALVAGEKMDATLLDACIIPTGQGIDLLASYSDQVFSPWETPQKTISNLFNLLNDQYDYVLFDVPRQIDPITFQAIEQSACVCVVMQQTLSDLRYAKQIFSLLRDQGLPNDRLRVLINRHDKKNVLRTGDIEDAFEAIPVTTLPNDFKRMAFATDNAVPLLRKFRKAHLSKGIMLLANKLFPVQEESKRGFFKRR